MNLVSCLQQNSDLMSIQMISFGRSYEQCVNLIKTIKLSNTRIQQMGETQPSASIQVEQQIVRSSKKKLQDLIVDMEKGYIDPQTSRKLNVIKKQLENQYTRYLKVSENFAKNSSTKNKSKHRGDRKFSESSGCESDGMQEIEFDFEHEKSLARQKSEQLNQVHRKLLNIQQISNTTFHQTLKQGEDLDIISDSIHTTLGNVKDSNQYLKQAQKEQQKSQKKYGWLGALIIIALVVLIFVGYLIFK